MAVEVNVARAWPAARLAKQDMVSSPETCAARPSKGASVSLRNLSKHYGKSKAITDYKEFPGRSHFTVGEDGWEEVADYALDWAVEHTATPTAA